MHETLHVDSAAPKLYLQSVPCVHFLWVNLLVCQPIYSAVHHVMQFVQDRLILANPKSVQTLNS